MLPGRGVGRSAHECLDIQEVRAWMLMDVFAGGTDLLEEGVMEYVRGKCANIYRSVGRSVNTYRGICRSGCMFAGL